jgi:hypothetical protein
MLYHHALAISINQCPYYLMLETPAKTKKKYIYVSCLGGKNYHMVPM